MTLIGFIIALVQHSANKTRLGAYHLRQVVGFMVTGVGLGILLWILAMNIFGGDYDSVAKYAVFVGVFSFLVWAVLLVCIIMGLINAVNGKEKPAPIFGEFYEKWFANMFN